MKLVGYAFALAFGLLFGLIADVLDERHQSARGTYRALCGRLKVKP